MLNESDEINKADFPHDWCYYVFTFESSTRPVMPLPPTANVLPRVLQRGLC